MVVWDNRGSVAIFIEDLSTTGMYIFPTAYSGVVGRSYTLSMELPDGKIYFSLPEVIIQPIE